MTLQTGLPAQEHGVKTLESALPVYNNSWPGVCTSYGDTDGSQRSPCLSRSGREAVHGKSVCSCEVSRGGAIGDSPPQGFGKSSGTSGELVGSGPEGAGRTVGLENCGLDAGTK